jgi:hypothetical protein
LYVIPKNVDGNSFYYEPEHIVIVTKRSEFLMKKFYAKGLSGRKIELDEVIEPEQDDQSSATPENVLEVATAFMAPTPTICCSPRHQSSYLTKLVIIK